MITNAHAVGQVHATYDDTARSEIFRGFTEQRTFEVRKRKSLRHFINILFK